MKRRALKRAGYAMVFILVLLALQMSLIFAGTRRAWLLDREVDAVWRQMVHRHASW